MTYEPLRARVDAYLATVRGTTVAGRELLEGRTAHEIADDASTLAMLEFLVQMTTALTNVASGLATALDELAAHVGYEFIDSQE